MQANLRPYGLNAGSNLKPSSFAGARSGWSEQHDQSLGLATNTSLRRDPPTGQVVFDVLPTIVVAGLASAAHPLFGLLPLRYTDNLEVRQVQRELQRAVAQPVAELAGAGDVRTRTTVYSGQLARYGHNLSAMKTAFSSEEGRNDFALRLEGFGQTAVARLLINSTAEMVHASGAWANSEASPLEDVTDPAEAILAITTMYGKQIQLYNGLARPGARFSIAVGDAKSSIAFYGGAPNTLLTGPEITARLSFAHVGYAMAWGVAPNGDMLKRSTIELPAYDNLVNVIVTDENGGTMLKRTSVVGEYYPMTSEVAAPTGFQSFHRTIRLYDQSKGRMVPVTLASAVENSGVFGGDGDYSPQLQRVVDDFNGNPGKHADRVHLFAVPDADGKVKLATFFGDLGLDKLGGIEHLMSQTARAQLTQDEANAFAAGVTLLRTCMVRPANGAIAVAGNVEQLRLNEAGIATDLVVSQLQINASNAGLASAAGINVIAGRADASTEKNQAIAFKAVAAKIERSIMGTLRGAFDGNFDAPWDHQPYPGSRVINMLVALMYPNARPLWVPLAGENVGRARTAAAAAAGLTGPAATAAADAAAAAAGGAGATTSARSLLAQAIARFDRQSAFVFQSSTIDVAVLRGAAGATIGSGSLAESALSTSTSVGEDAIKRLKSLAALVKANKLGTPNDTSVASWRKHLAGLMAKVTPEELAAVDNEPAVDLVGAEARPQGFARTPFVVEECDDDYRMSMPGFLAQIDPTSGGGGAAGTLAVGANLAFIAREAGSRVGAVDAELSGLRVGAKRGRMDDDDAFAGPALGRSRGLEIGAAEYGGARQSQVRTQYIADAVVAQAPYAVGENASANMRAAIDELGYLDPLVAVQLVVLLGLKINKANCVHLAQAMNAPFAALLFRPLIRHHAAMAAVVAGGPQYGFNWFSEVDVQGDIGTSKEYRWAFTFQALTLVHAPQLARILPDVLLLRYIGGNDVSFVKMEKNKRVGSIFAALIPLGEVANLPNPLPMSGKWMLSGAENNEVMDQLTYTGAALMRALYPEVVTAAVDVFGNQTSNDVCFLGPYDVHTGSTTPNDWLEHDGTGHFRIHEGVALSSIGPLRNGHYAVGNSATEIMVS